MAIGLNIPASGQRGFHGITDIPGDVIVRIGESDCEALGDEFLAQPVNAWTSLSYVVVGLVVATMASRGRGHRRESLVYATCVAAVGLGSVLFHGPQPDGSRVLHDLPILVTVIFIAIHDLHLIRSRFDRPLTAFVVSALTATGIAVVSVDAAAVVTGLVLVVVAVLELVIYRKGLRPSNRRAQRHAYQLIIAVAAVAGTAYLLGRTDSPACDPNALWQFHGAWHVISSLLFGLWWWLAIGQPERTPATQ